MRECDPDPKYRAMRKLLSHHATWESLTTQSNTVRHRTNLMASAKARGGDGGESRPVNASFAHEPKGVPKKHEPKGVPKKHEPKGVPENRVGLQFDELVGGFILSVGPLAAQCSDDAHRYNESKRNQS